MCTSKLEYIEETCVFLFLQCLYTSMCNQVASSPMHFTLGKNHSTIIHIATTIQESQITQFITIIKYSKCHRILINQSGETELHIPMQMEFFKQNKIPYVNVTNWIFLRKALMITLICLMVPHPMQNNSTTKGQE